MGPFKFAIKMLRLEYKKTFLYALTLVVTVAIVFMFLNYAQNPYLGNDINHTQNVQSNVNSINFGTLMCMVMICISVLSAVFSNNVYLIKKIDEIAVEQISGGSIGEVSKYLIGQNFAIGLFSIPAGVLVGYLLNPVLNSYLFTSLGITNGKLWEIYPETVSLTISYIFVLICAITIFNTGFVYRNDILSLLHMNISIKPQKKGNGLSVPYFVIWIIAIIPFILYMFANLTNPQEYLMAALIGVVGVYGLYSKGLTKVFEAIQSKFNLCKPIELISLGNLKYSIAKTKSLVITINLAIIGLMCYCIIYVKSPKDFAIIYISYIVCIFLMTLMVLYKIMLENDSHAHIFKSLLKLGYTNRQVKKIIRKEVFYYYAILLFFISIYAIPILVHFINIGVIKLLFGIQLFILYFVPISLSSVIAYYNYKAQVFHKEG